MRPTAPPFNYAAVLKRPPSEPVPEPPAKKRPAMKVEEKESNNVKTESMEQTAVQQETVAVKSEQLDPLPSSSSSLLVPLTTTTTTTQSLPDNAWVRVASTKPVVGPLEAALSSTSSSSSRPSKQRLDASGKQQSLGSKKTLKPTKGQPYKSSSTTSGNNNNNNGSKKNSKQSGIASSQPKQNQQPGSKQKKAKQQQQQQHNNPYKPKPSKGVQFGDVMNRAVNGNGLVTGNPGRE